MKTFMNRMTVMSVALVLFCVAAELRMKKVQETCPMTLLV